MDKSLNEQSLIQEIDQLNNRIAELTNVNNSLLKYCKDSQILLEVISRLNTQSSNMDLNMNLALTSLSGIFDAEQITLYEKTKDNTFKPINKSKQYTKQINDKTIDDFNLSNNLPIVFQSLLNNTIITLTDSSLLTSAFKRTDIQSITLAPIIINNELTNLIVIVNAKNNCDIMRYVTPHFKEALLKMKKENQIRQMIITDNSTGIYNRDYYNQICKSINPTIQNSLGVVYIDLNNLKKINDTYGHEAGDIYIKTVAEILKKHFTSDMIFRIGGDEFVIICKEKTLEYIEISVNNANNDLKNTHLKCNKGTIDELFMSIGVAYQTENFDIEALIHEADELMYKDKQTFYQKNNYKR